MASQQLSPPTSILPPLRGLAKYSPQEITAILSTVQDLYWPSWLSPSVPLDLLPSCNLDSARRLAQEDPLPDSGYASEDEDGTSLESDTGEEIEILRQDPFERAFTVKWLAGFIARSDCWINESFPQPGMTADTVVALAAALLAAFVGGDEDTDISVTRKFRFPTTSDKDPILIELNDAPLPAVDHTSVGLQSWASSIILAHLMCERPARFGLGEANTPKVLEIGAGTGLLSIAIAKLMSETHGGILKDQIVATDYHPEVLSNLRRNIATNLSPSPTSSQSLVLVRPLDWQHPQFSPPLEQGSFDLILAADVIYEPKHAAWIHNCVSKLLRPPRSGSAYGRSFWLMLPLRATGRHEDMEKTVDLVFSSAGEGWRLSVLERATMEKREGVGRADETSYILYKIGWANTGL